MTSRLTIDTITPMYDMAFSAFPTPVFKLLSAGSGDTSCEKENTFITHVHRLNKSLLYYTQLLFTFTTTSKLGCNDFIYNVVYSLMSVG